MEVDEYMLDAKVAVEISANPTIYPPGSEMMYSWLILIFYQLAAIYTTISRISLPGELRSIESSALSSRNNRLWKNEFCARRGYWLYVASQTSSNALSSRYLGNIDKNSHSPCIECRSGRLFYSLTRIRTGELIESSKNATTSKTARYLRFRGIMHWKESLEIGRRN